MAAILYGLIAGLRGKNLWKGDHQMIVFRYKTSGLDFCEKCKKLTMHDFETYYDKHKHVDKVVIKCCRCDTSRRGK